MSQELPVKQQELQSQDDKAPKNEITKMLLTADRQRAADVLTQLKFQLSRNVSSMEIK